MLHYSKIFAAILFALLLSCSDDGTEPVVPKTEITAKISGYLNLDYVSSGFFTSTTGNGKYIINAAGTMSGDTNYKFLIALVYPDQATKPGLFQVVTDPFDHTETVVYAQFTIERKDSSIVFVADSGIVDIKEIDKRMIKGNFAFFTTEKNGTGKLKIENGILDIFNY
jgi:hypothetical protein